LYLVVVVSDITEQVRIGAEREALIVELEAKNKELERFTYTVSHDLKSPLVTIKGFLDFLKQDVQAGDSEKIQTDIASISSAVAKMQQLLDELLELSRIGRVIKQPETALLGELAQEALDTVAGRVAERGVEVHIAPGLLRPGGPTVYGDRLRLREALENLLDNAVKYMGDQPRPRVEIGVRQDGKDRIFYVQDNGIGIEARYHQRVFGLFDKLDPDSEGVGVGLAVVKRIVEVHGGRVWVESAGAGQGSTFCFTLPRDQTGGDQSKIRRTR
jgi:signal transduction histidine kinase